MALIQVSELSEFTQIDILFQSIFHKLVEEDDHVASLARHALEGTLVYQMGSLLYDRYRKIHGL